MARSTTGAKYTYGRQVFHAAARWRAYAFVFPAMGIGALLFALSITWSNGIESGDLHPVAGALAIGLLLTTLCFWLFSLIFWGIHLVVAPDGIAYYSGGISITTTWDDVQAVDRRMAGAWMEGGLLLGRPVLRVRGIAGFLSLFGMAVAPRSNRQALARFATTGRYLVPIDPDTYTRFIPLSVFRPDWENEQLGEIVRHYAPQAFGGQPLPPVARPASDGTALSLAPRRVPVWAKLIGAVALEAAGAAGLLFYAGGQVLPVRTLSAGVISADSLAFSPDSTMLVSAQGITANKAFAFSPDGKTLATSSDVQLWHVPNGAHLRDLTYKGGKYGVTLLRVADWTQVRHLGGPTDEVESVMFSPDGRLVVAGSHESAVRAWRAADGTLLHTFSSTNGGDDPITSVALIDGGKSVVANFGPEDSALSEWRLSDGRSTGNFLADYYSPGCYESCFYIFTLAGRPDGKALALGDTDGHVVVVGSDGTQLGAYSTGGKAAYSLAFSPDGLLLAAGLEDGHVRVWRVRDGALLATVFLGTGTDGAAAVAISPDDRALAASVEYGPLRLWNISRLAL